MKRYTRQRSYIRVPHFRIVVEEVERTTRTRSYVPRRIERPPPTAFLYRLGSELVLEH